VQQVTLYIDVDRTLKIVSELKKHGWVMGKDFDFAYNYINKINNKLDEFRSIV
jgi:hypothetical protein